MLRFIVPFLLPLGLEPNCSHRIMEKDYATFLVLNSFIEGVTMLQQKCTAVRQDASQGPTELSDLFRVQIFCFREYKLYINKY